MSIYRTAAIIAEPPVNKNTYKFLLHEENRCPICRKADDYYVYVTYNEKNYTVTSEECHPLKRLVIGRSWWFWKKYCPVEKIHDHFKCSACKISWIKFSEKKYEPNYQERLLCGPDQV